MTAITNRKNNAGTPVANPYDAGVKKDIFIPEMELTRLIDEAILKYGDRTCTDFLGARMTYAQIGREITKAAKGLQDMGVGPGSKVGMYMPNSPYYPILFFATLKTGATVVNFDLSYTKEKLTAQIKDSGVTMMAVTELPEYISKLDDAYASGDIKTVIRCPIAAQLPTIKSLGFQFKMAVEGFRGKHPDYKVREESIVEYTSLTDKNGLYRSVHVKPDDLAVLQYTGGTTGTPKGAMLSHKNLVANMLQINEFFGREGKSVSHPHQLEQAQETTLAALPYFHVYSMTVGMIMSMNIGAKIVIIPDPQNLKQFVKSINKEQPTLVPVVPKLLRALLDKKSELPKYNFDSVKVFISGGAALAPELKKEFEAATKTTIYQGYGLSETSPVVSGHNPLAGANNNDDSVGFAMPNTDIKLIAIEDPDSTAPWVDLAEGETGEICVRGPQVMQGYWNKPDENKKVLQNGWFRTGDIGHIKDGQVYITDRIKDMININGKKIFPLEVEKKILKHPAIAECNIVNVADKSTGEAAMAFIRFKPGAQVPSEAELRTWFDSVPLAKLEKPKHIVFWAEELPKTRVGKPDKKELRVIANRILSEAKSALPPAPQI
jgi:long-chain acyl-CoA synthetase